MNDLLAPPKPSYIVQQIVQELDDVRSYLFDYGTSPFPFLPGQFAVVSVPEEKIEAPITISSSPTQRSSFQITIKNKGSFGSRFYHLTKVGTIVTVGKPAGNFRLTAEELPLICFLGRDFGITAARSFASFLADSPLRREMTLLHELSDVNQALFAHEFADARYSWMRKFYLLDNPQVARNTAFWSGAVSPEVIMKFVPHFSSTNYFMAGEGNDIVRWRKILLDLQIPSPQIHVEKWSPPSKN